MTSRMENNIFKPHFFFTEYRAYLRLLLEKMIEYKIRMFLVLIELKYNIYLVRIDKNY